MNVLPSPYFPSNILFNETLPEGTYQLVIAATNTEDINDKGWQRVERKVQIKVEGYKTPADKYNEMTCVQLAQEILNRNSTGKIILDTVSPTTPNNTAMINITDTANGKKVKTGLKNRDGKSTIQDQTYLLIPYISNLSNNFPNFLPRDFSHIKNNMLSRHLRMVFSEK